LWREGRMSRRRWRRGRERRWRRWRRWRLIMKMDRVRFMDIHPVALKNMKLV